VLRTTFAGLCLVFLLIACKTHPKPGEVCGGRDIGHGMCADSAHVLTCRAFTWRLDACHGPVGCTPQGDEARCDQRIADEGESCGDATARACSADGTTLLRCDGSRMIGVQRCRGPRGCYRDAPEAPASCDQGGAEVDDPCDATGNHCSADGRTILKCAPSHRYALARTCAGPRGCFRAGESLVCDVSIGEVGEGCDGDGGSWCSRDGTQENTCRSGVLAKKQTCSRCTADWASDGKSFRILCAQ
jgi:hypothetical protein